MGARETKGLFGEFSTRFEYSWREGGGWYGTKRTYGQESREKKIAPPESSIQGAQGCLIEIERASRLLGEGKVRDSAQPDLAEKI